LAFAVGGCRLADDGRIERSELLLRFVSIVAAAVESDVVHCRGPLHGERSDVMELQEGALLAPPSRGRHERAPVSVALRDFALHFVRDVP